MACTHRKVHKFFKKYTNNEQHEYISVNTNLVNK